MVRNADEWIRKMTHALVAYLDTPADVRMRARQMRRQARVLWADRLFGMWPYVLRRWWDQWRSRR